MISGLPRIGLHFPMGIEGFAYILSGGVPELRVDPEAEGPTVTAATRTCHGGTKTGNR